MPNNFTCRHFKHRSRFTRTPFLFQRSHYCDCIFLLCSRNQFVSVFQANTTKMTFNFIFVLTTRKNEKRFEEKCHYDECTMKASLYRLKKVQLNVFLLLSLKFRHDIAFYEIKNGECQRFLFELLSTGTNRLGSIAEFVKIFAGSMNFDFNGAVYWKISRG